MTEPAVNRTPRVITEEDFERRSAASRLNERLDVLRAKTFLKDRGYRVSEPPEPWAKEIGATLLWFSILGALVLAMYGLACLLKAVAR